MVAASCAFGSRYCLMVYLCSRYSLRVTAGVAAPCASLSMMVQWLSWCETTLTPRSIAPPNPPPTAPPGPPPAPPLGAWAAWSGPWLACSSGPCSKSSVRSTRYSRLVAAAAVAAASLDGAPSLGGPSAALG